MKTIIFAFLILCSINTSEKLYTEGNKYFESKEYTDAMYSFVILLKENPDFKKSDEIKFKIARCFEEDGFIEQAVVWYKKLLKENPDSQLIKDTNKKLEELKDKENTENIDNEVKTDESNSAPIEVNLDTSSLAEEEYNKGLELINESKASNVSHKDPLQRYSKGIGVLRNLIIKYPSTKYASEAQNIIANCYIEAADKYFTNKDYVTARKYYEKISKIYPLCNVADYALYKFIQCQDLKIYEDFYSLDQRDVPSMYKRLIKEYTELSERYPKSNYVAEGLQRAGCLYGSIGDVDNQLKIYKKIVNNFPSAQITQDVQYYICIIYFEVKKDYAQAKIEFEKYIKNYPNGINIKLANEYLNKIRKK